jgi:dTDP-4-dehydrorhamnose reductase
MSPPAGHAWTGRTLLVFGGNGQVGRAITSLVPPEGWRVVAAGREQADITRPREVSRFVSRVAPDVVVNAAAFTAVDDAESQAGAADQVNREGAGHVAAAALEVGAPVIHLSTDYVFDGRLSRPLREADPVGPLSVYGETKEAGERIVRRLHSGHVILRTAWVFGSHGRNFVRTMLRLGAERPALRVVADQRGCPTAATDLARAIWWIARNVTAADKDVFGTFHFAGTRPVSWFEFAGAIFAEAARHGRPAPELTPIPTQAYPTPARRPAYSVLDCGRIGAIHGIAAPDWRDGLTACVDTLLKAQSKPRAEGVAA